MLKNLKKKAKYIIDTTNVTEKELKKIIEEKMSMDENDMLVNFMSFGYKYGLPKDVDLLFDVRLLPNPYYVEELRKETGLKKEVSDYVYENEEAQNYYQETVRYLEYLLPMYEKEGRKQFIVGIGCTGGKHRSVATTEKIKDFFAGKYKVVVSHRDLGRE